MNVVKLNVKKPPPILDTVFFHKTQLKVGTQLLHYGRLMPKTTWEVVEIRTLICTKFGNFRSHRVQTPEHLSDIVRLRCLDVRAVREVTFGTLSYSAIWRLAE